MAAPTQVRLLPATQHHPEVQVARRPEQEPQRLIEHTLESDPRYREHKGKGAVLFLFPPAFAVDGRDVVMSHRKRRLTA